MYACLPKPLTLKLLYWVSLGCIWNLGGVRRGPRYKLRIELSRKHVICNSSFNVKPSLNFLSFLKKHVTLNVCYIRGTQIPDTKLPWRLHIVRWRQIFVGSQHGTCFVSPVWHLNFGGGS